MPDVLRITPDDPAWPARLVGAAQSVVAIGNPAALGGRVLALLCSVACPGDIILALGDLALALREAGVTVASGFHAPMEREVLHFLLRGTQPIILCPARGIVPYAIRPELRGALAGGRLLILSPFADAERRITINLATRRNRFVATLADAVCIAHARAGGQLAQLAAEIVAQGKPLLTLPSPHNAHLVALGAQALTVNEMVAWWKQSDRDMK